MGAIPILLIVWPALAAAVLPCIQDRRVRGGAVYGAAVGVMVLASALLAAWMAGGAGRVELYVETELIDHAMLLGELVLMGLIILLSIRHRKYPIILLSAGQTLLVAWSELTDPVSPAAHMRVDGLAMLLCIIAAFVGGFICIYAVGYMKAYHQHHEDYIDRSGFFFSMLFLFLAAMFGLVLSENLVWMYFFWEITSVVSFLLIGYTHTEEAVNNSFRALWMNLLGGFGFAVAISYAAAVNDTVQLTQVVASGAAIPVVLLAFAALTKSAQMPFSSWLLGAMVAPTPSSALLHSATMVKAGVYLLIRLAPALAVMNIAEYYEMTLMLGLVALFFLNSNPISWPVAIAACLLVYFLEILWDNVSARVKWKALLDSCWVFTLLTGGLNGLILMLIR